LLPADNLLNFTFHGSSNPTEWHSVSFVVAAPLNLVQRELIENKTANVLAVLFPKLERVKISYFRGVFLERTLSTSGAINLEALPVNGYAKSSLDLTLYRKSKKSSWRHSKLVDCEPYIDPFQVE
jgi:hypothetical protein